MLVSRFSSLLVLVVTASWPFLTGCGSAPEVSNLNKGASPTLKATPGEIEVSGEYKVTGANENSGDKYEGVLTIANQEDAYRFFWHNTRSRPSGVGSARRDGAI